MLTILSPHFDDAAFSLALSIKAILNTGCEVRLINCYNVSGDAPLSTVEGTAAVSALRTEEDRRFVAHRDFDAAEQEAITRLTAKLRLLHLDGPYLVPMAFGNHIDHRITRAAAEHILPRIQLAYYEDLPYSLSCADDSLFLEAIGDETVHPVVIGPHPTWMHHKLQAVLCYPSQIDPAGAVALLQRAKAYGGGERIWASDGFLDELTRFQVDYTPWPNEALAG
jgi:LmbE family N-acetylglucosaminyl deacetylase